MRSCLPFWAALVPSIRKAYLPARTGSVTILMLADLGAPCHCSVVPVSKSPRQRTSAETEVADMNGIASSNTRYLDLDRVIIFSPGTIMRHSFRRHQLGGEEHAHRAAAVV